jgi:exopolysaccharide production protein ExoZ
MKGCSATEIEKIGDYKNNWSNAKNQARNCLTESFADDVSVNYVRSESQDAKEPTLQRSSPNFTLHTTLPLPAKISQIDGLQVLRAVAVFLVAWLHAGQELGDWRVAELPHFAAFGIDIFFVISGLIMCSVLLRNRQVPGIRATWGFLKRRLIRIFPIYWVFALLESARLLHGRGFFLRNYFPSFLLLPGLYPRYPLIVGFSWTMVFEMFFYYVLATILLFTVRWAVPVSIAFFGAAVLLGRMFGVQHPVWITFTSPMLLEFIFGAIAAVALFHFRPRRRFGIAVLIVGVAASLYMRAHPEKGGAAGIDMVLSSVGAMRHALTWGLAAMMIVSGVVFWSPSIQSLPGRIAVILGNASYSAYLASPLVIEFTGRLLIKLGRHATVGEEVLFQTVIVLVVFLVGWVSYQFVEWPMIRWLQANL